jgi:hypothetical protein
MPQWSTTALNVALDSFAQVAPCSDTYNSPERTLVRATRWIGLMIVMTLATSTPAAADPLPGGPGPAPPLPTEIQPPGPGTVTLLAPGRALSTIAAVNGTIRAYDRPVTLQWEYGTTSAYGQRTAPVPWPAATGGGPVGIGGMLTGLAPQTSYHYRLDIISDIGTFTSEDGIITTTPEAPVKGRMGASVLVSGSGSLLTVDCTGEADNSCVGCVRISATQTVGRGRHRHRRVVLMGTGSFSFSTGPITGPGAVTADIVRNGEQVPISLTPAGRALVARYRHLWATATLSIQRGAPETARVLFRPDTARGALPTSGPRPTALYGSGTCQLTNGPRPLGYVGCSGSWLLTDSRGRVTSFTAPYNHGKHYQCTAEIDTAKPATVPVDGRFHFTATTAQGSHGPRGSLRVSGRFTSSTAAHGSYRYDLGRGCHDRQRSFRMRFIGTPGT